MPDNRVDTTRPEYSWIPFFEELALRLHEDGWRDRQGEIVAELQRMWSDDILVNKFVNNLDDLIDPFSVFAMIRRVGWDNAQPIMERYKVFFGIDVDLPKEEPTNPSITPQNSLFFSGVPERLQVDPHWDLFEYVMLTEVSRADSDGDRLESLLDRSEAVNGAGVATVTGALYWIQPHRFLKQDTIDHFLGDGDYSNFGKRYIERLNRLRGHDARPFPLLNNEAWRVGQFRKDPKAVALWMVAAGVGNDLADEFVDGGFSAIGWYHELDPADFESSRELQNTLKSIWSPQDAGQVASFQKDIKRGDVIVMRTGNPKELRYGLVASHGTYSVDVENMRIRRGVMWRPGRITADNRDLPRANTVSRVREARDALLDRIMVAEGMLVPDPPVPEPPVSTEPVDWPSDEVFLEEHEQLDMLALLRRKQNLILQGPPGTGKTFIAKRLAYALMGERADDRIASVQFHQSYSYEDFVGGFRPSINEKAQLVFQARDGAFLRLCEEAREDTENDYVMLIDEINRGNLSRVFGELLMLIEADKREERHAVELQHREQMPDADTSFFVPPNVYIIGTMNLADRSLTGMNIAMRRRFAFRDLTPQFESPRFREWIQDAGMPGYLQEHILKQLEALNGTIEKDASLGKQYAIGHSFFTPSRDGRGIDDWDAWYESVVEYEIRPLLEEYWFDQSEKADTEVGKLAKPQPTDRTLE